MNLNTPLGWVISILGFIVVVVVFVWVIKQFV